MHRFLRPILFAAAALSFPAAAQTPPTQGWPANRAPAAPAQTPLAPPAAAAPAPAPAPAANAPIPLPLWFTEIDTAKKGEVSRPDFLTYRMKTFVELDANKDGKLTLDEFLAAAPPIKTAETPEQMLQRLDTNHDGKVSIDEFRAPQLATFNKVDANHDGVVTPAEFQAAQKRK